MTKRIFLVHASDTQALATLVARRLSGVGTEVEALAADKLNGAAHGADRIIVLWSRGAAVTGLDARLKRAQDAGKLSVVRLASAPTPTRLRAHVVYLPRPNDPDDAWRALAGAHRVSTKTPAPKLEREFPGSRWHALLVAALMSLVAVSAAYHANPTVAAGVDAFASAVINRLN